MAFNEKLQKLYRLLRNVYACTGRYCVNFDGLNRVAAAIIYMWSTQHTSPPPHMQGVFDPLRRRYICLLCP